jgi:uncharacterized membrane protein
VTRLPPVEPRLRTRQTRTAGFIKGGTLVTRNPGESTRRQLAGAMAPRLAYVDVFRGLLVAHMALDHASLFFNARRSAEELAAGAAPVFDDVFQFLTRFLGVPVAPGFFFMAGVMVALTSGTQEQRGVPHRQVTRQLVIRGLVLIAVDAIVMGLPRALMGFYSFMTLSSIGVALIALAWLRDVPSRILVPVSLGILILHPLFDVSALPVAIQAILYEPVRSGAFRSMYPVFPWIGIVLLGFVVGRDARRNEKPARLWLALAAISLIAFVLTRASGGYGNAFAYTTVDSFAFWTFAKYPPDLPFLTWSFACIFVALAALSRVAGNGVPAVLRPFELFGRVPFFFFVVHFYVLGVAQAILLTRTDLPTTYLIWALLMLGMAWPCAWYYRKKRERPNLITRHF